MKWGRRKRGLVFAVGMLLAALVGLSLWMSRPPKVTFVQFRPIPGALLIDFEIENNTGSWIGFNGERSYQVQSPSGWVTIDSPPTWTDPNFKPAIFLTGKQRIESRERVTLESLMPDSRPEDNGRYPFPFRIGFIYWRPYPMLTSAAAKLFNYPLLPKPEIAWSEPITSQHLEADPL